MNHRGFRESAAYRWWVLYSVAIGIFVVFLDTSILNVCFPRLVGVFGISPSVAVWVNIVYLIITQSFVLLCGRIGDTKGRKKVYLAGLVFYALGLLVCALSKSVTQLFLGRIIQGVGAAAVLSLSTAMAVAVFPATERGRALGILASTRSLGLVAGPVFGGLILSLLDWRGVFYGRLPFVLLSFFMAWIIIEEQKGAESRLHLDLPGSGSLFCWLSGLLLFFSFGSRFGFTSNPALGLGAFTAVSLAIFLLVERRSPEPFMDLSLFRKPLFASATVSAMLQGAATIMVVSLGPFFLIGSLGYSALATGMFAAVLSLPSLVLAPLSGRLSDRIGSRALSTIGMSLLFIGLLILSCLAGRNPGTFAILVALCLQGIGLGIFQAPNNSSMVGSVPREKLGTASAIAVAATQLGVSAGFAIGGAVFGVRQLLHASLLSGQGLAPSLVAERSIADSFSDTLMIAVVFSGIGILTSLVRGPHRPSEPERTNGIC
jgi:EmrB/QacA subfamily drug resistance transporter